MAKKQVNIEELFMNVPEQLQDKPKVTTSTQMIPVNSHRFPLRGEILEPEHYSEEIDCINNMSEHDTCDIYINTEGGSLNTTMELLNAFDNTQGTVRANIVGNCMSAGSFIALRAHEVYVGDHIAFMIHSPSGMFAGRFEDVHAQSDFYKEFTSTFYNDIYQGFLTPEEIERTLEGKTFYMGAEEVKERLDKRQKYFEEKLEEMQEGDSGVLEDAEKMMVDLSSEGSTGDCPEDFFPELTEEDGWIYVSGAIQPPKCEFVEMACDDLIDAYTTKELAWCDESPAKYREITEDAYFKYKGHVPE